VVVLQALQVEEVLDCTAHNSYLSVHICREVKIVKQGWSWKVAQVGWVVAVATGEGVAVMNQAEVVAKGVADLCLALAHPHLLVLPDLAEDSR